MTDRDTFAAAALAGLLVHANDGIDEETLDTPSDIAYTAYAMADAMLRERERKNHDAAPAARAHVDAAGISRQGTGDTPVTKPMPKEKRAEVSAEPVAWAVAGDYGDYAAALFSDKASAQTEADRRALVGLRPGYVVVPLYRSPTLADAEREAIERGYCSLMGVEDMSAECTRWDAEAAAVLRGLLERLGGGR